MTMNHIFVGSDEERVQLVSILTRNGYVTHCVFWEATGKWEIIYRFPNEEEKEEVGKYE